MQSRLQSSEVDRMQVSSSRGLDKTVEGDGHPLPSLIYKRFFNPDRQLAQISRFDQLPRHSMSRIERGDCSHRPHPEIVFMNSLSALFTRATSRRYSSASSVSRLST